MENKKNNKVIIIVLICIIILLIALCICFALGIIKISDKQVENSTNKIDNVTTNVENSTNNANSKKSFEDMFAEYIVSYLKKRADNNYIVKGLDGNVTSEKLTSSEVDSKKSEYLAIIKSNLQNESIFSKVFDLNGKKAITFKYIEVLKLFGFSTPVPPVLIAEGKFLYFEGKEDSVITKNSFEEYGIDENIAIEKIYNKLKDATSKQAILKSTTGDISAEKLTLDELSAKETEYKEKIKQELESLYTRYFYNNGTLTIDFQWAFLNQLGLSSHQGVEIINQRDESGNLVYRFELSK